MAITQAAGEGAAYEKVWATLQEITQRQAETGRLMKENAQGFRELKESGERVDKRLEQLSATVDRVAKNAGGLNRSLGELVETLIAARLWEKFGDYNLQRAYRRVPIYDGKGRGQTEIDILLSNSDCAVAVEVKNGLDKTDDVDRHLKRMELIRRYPPAEVKINSKRLMGAMAGGSVSLEVKNYAHESGLFVLELTGETVSLVPPPAGFSPKVW